MKNPSAFPSPGVVMTDGRQQGAYEGMTLRDYFADFHWRVGGE